MSLTYYFASLYTVGTSYAIRNAYLTFTAAKKAPVIAQGVNTMKNYIEEGLVLAGMLAVLLGVMFVAAATLS